MLRNPHRTIAAAEAGVDEALVETSRRVPSHPFLAGLATPVTSAASRSGRADTAGATEGAARAMVEIRA